MRIVFMGTPEFAVVSLKSLLENKFDVVGVVTVPDKPAGRGQQLHESAVKKFAVENNLKLLQPEKLKDPQFIFELKELKADLQIVVAFRMLPEVVWDMPKLGTYNLHASLLPKYRGAAPINWAIINGERETGVTTFKLKHEIDTGNILFQERVEISKTMNAGELHDTLMVVGSRLIVKTVKEIEKSAKENKTLEFNPQEDANACHAPKIFKEMCKIDWTKPGMEIYNLVRGLSPYPAAFTEIHSQEQSSLSLKIFNCKYESVTHHHTNGSLLTDNKNFLKVYVNEGIIELTDIQLQGKRRMSIKDFLRGFRIPTEMRLG